MNYLHIFIFSAIALTAPLWSMDLEDNGCFELHDAAITKDVALIKKLLAQGADISLRNNQGKTALQLVVDQMLKDWEIAAATNSPVEQPRIEVLSSLAAGMSISELREEMGLAMDYGLQIRNKELFEKYVLGTLGPILYYKVSEAEFYEDKSFEKEECSTPGHGSSDETTIRACSACAGQYENICKSCHRSGQEFKLICMSEIGCLYCNTCNGRYKLYGCCMLCKHAYYKIDKGSTCDFHRCYYRNL